jgi:hypothetical protein
MGNPELNYTLFDLVDAVREAAAENPDFVYARRDFPNCEGVCTYTMSDGTPDCIIGVGLAKCGDPVPAWDEQKFYRISKDREIAGFAKRVWDDYFNPTSESEYIAFNWLACVQTRQDAGEAWGEAIEVANSRFPRIMEIHPAR